MTVSELRSARNPDNTRRRVSGSASHIPVIPQRTLITCIFLFLKIFLKGLKVKNLKKCKSLRKVFVLLL